MNALIGNTILTKLSDVVDIDHSSPLQDHPQVIQITDILSNHYQNDLLIESPANKIVHLALLHAISKKCKTKTMYLLNTTFLSTPDWEMALLEKLNNLNNAIIILSIIDSLVNKQIIAKLARLKQHHASIRILLFSEHKLAYFPMTTISLEQPSEQLFILLLKYYTHPLAKQYGIEISDEIIYHAFSLAKHYLPGTSFDAALQLLDCAAIRRNPDTAIDTHLLSQIISDWTHIPLSHLYYNKFKLSKFTESLQKNIAGQPHAIKIIGTLLQANSIESSERKTACNFIFSGEHATGKKTFCFALAEYLYGTQHSILQIDYHTTHEHPSLADIMVITTEKNPRRLSLLDAVREKPYAILIAENFENAPKAAQKLIETLFALGYGFDKKNRRVTLQHTINIITTILGASCIRESTQQIKSPATSEFDLMQLVLNNIPQPTDIISQLSLHEIQEKIYDTIHSNFSSQLMKHAHIVPFFPLEQASIEKIIKLKLEQLREKLEREFLVELSYTPDIIQYIACECFLKKRNMQSLHLSLENILHAPIANAILGRIDKKNPAKRLALYLNDSGETIECHFLSANEDSLYTL